MSLIKRTMIAAAISTAFVASANAGSLNYNYLDVNYVSNSVAGISGSGFGVDASFGVSDDVNVYVGYQAPSILGVTISETILGVGFHQPIDDKSDWYVKGDYRSFTAVNTATGFSFSGGARSALSENFEIDGYIGYASYSISGLSFSGAIFGIDGVLKVSDNIGITAGYMSDSDAFGWTGIKIGARMNF